MELERRQFLTLSVKSAMAAGFVSSIPISLLNSSTASAEILAAGLSDPALQPMFTERAPNALDPGFFYEPNRRNRLKITAKQTRQRTGLVAPNGRRLRTKVWGYGTDDDEGVSWPGRTIEYRIGDDPIRIKWQNQLENRNGRPLRHLLPVDENLHWAYALHGHTSVNGRDYRQYSIRRHGVPLVPHVHGGRNHTDSDGNPEYFFSPGYEVRGPRFATKWYEYGGPEWNDVAGMLWYHDHALGITRLNVYAGLAGFFVVRDDIDTGHVDNPAGLPAGPYELAYAVQDRMFDSRGQLFMSAFPGDPFYADFIDDEEAELPPDRFPNGGPTALAEFFGDHMLVNGKIWPKGSVEPRQYRVRFLNGTDSRFMRLRLRVVPGGASDDSATDLPPGDTGLMPFMVVGSDQGLRTTAETVTECDFVPGERLDLVVDFSTVPYGSRVIVENLLGDAPFGGDLPEPEDLFPNRRTDRVMAFDVEVPIDTSVPDTSVGGPIPGGPGVDVGGTVTRTRTLALFEGKDEFGRLQPLLGVAEPTPIFYDDGSPMLRHDGTQVVLDGSLAWHHPITENPDVGDTEIWEIYNATGDAHPVHVHLVHFEVLDRQDFTADTIMQPTIQHDGSVGIGFRLENIAKTPGTLDTDLAPAEETRRDMVMALPDTVTRIKMHFSRPGRYVWHCHILSHEDHEMMRPMHVGPGAVPVGTMVPHGV